MSFRVGEYPLWKNFQDHTNTKIVKSAPSFEKQLSLFGDDDFDHVFEYVIDHEGFYSNDKFDPGGETKYGISKKSYPHLDIASLTLQDAKEIYYYDYWLRSSCDKLPDGLAYAVFDAAVNTGIGNAIKWLQEAVGTVADGVIGPATKRAITRSMNDPVNVLEILNANRLKYYMGLHNINGRYGVGWSRRVLQVHTKSMDMLGKHDV